MMSWSRATATTLTPIAVAFATIARFCSGLKFRSPTRTTYRSDLSSDIPTEQSPDTTLVDHQNDCSLLPARRLCRMITLQRANASMLARTCTRGRCAAQSRRCSRIADRRCRQRHRNERGLESLGGFGRSKPPLRESANCSRRRVRPSWNSALCNPDSLRLPGAAVLFATGRLIINDEKTRGQNNELSRQLRSKALRYGMAASR